MVIVYQEILDLCLKMVKFLFILLRKKKALNVYKV